MKSFAISAAVAAVIAASLGSAQASPVCGSTTTVSSGDSVSAAYLLAGNCVLAGDKLFGGFKTISGFTGAGSASFSWLDVPGNVTIGFAGAIGPNTTATLVYNVSVDSTLSDGYLIDDLEKDFTLNTARSGIFASATLTGSTSPVTSPPVAIFCKREVNPSFSDCPETATFAPVASIQITETIKTGPNAIVTALTDTISQVAPIDEPASILMFLTGLLGLAGVTSRRLGQVRVDTQRAAK